MRERRRLVDRLHSLFRPIRRYRCEDFACQWVGNIADTDAARSGTTLAADVQFRSDKKKPTGRVPASFVVHMVLVAAGVVFVMVYSTMEPAAWQNDDEQTAGSGLYEAFVQPLTSIVKTR
ncbi:MAG: hypothetical protein ABJA49_06740 [Betaproteobacteria bacterium]